MPIYCSTISSGNVWIIAGILLIAIIAAVVIIKKVKSKKNEKQPDIFIVRLLHVKANFCLPRQRLAFLQFQAKIRQISTKTGFLEGKFLPKGLLFVFVRQKNRFTFTCTLHSKEQMPSILKTEAGGFEPDKLRGCRHFPKFQE